MCVIERDGKVVIIDQTAEIERLRARIKELEAVLKEADQYRRASLDRVMKIANQLDNLKTLNDALMENGNGLRSRAQKAEARIKELEVQVAALQEIAVRLVAISEYETENWSRSVIPWEEISVEWAEHYKNKARHQLSEEHPEVDWK